MKKILHQIIFCSERERRAFRRDIEIGDYNAVVCDIEKLPPHYDIAMERMRDSNEEILQYQFDNITVPAEFHNCPYCGKSGIFYCDCGVISCKMAGAKTHTCPSCKRVLVPKPTNKFPMSKSGFVHGNGVKAIPGDRQGAGAVGRNAPALPQPRRLELPSPEKEDARARVRKFLSDQRKPVEGDKP